MNGHTLEEQAVLLWQWRMGAVLQWRRGGNWRDAVTYEERLRDHLPHAPNFKYNHYRIKIE